MTKSKSLTPTGTSRVHVPLPREHGAWAMLVLALVFGQVVAGYFNLPALLLWLAALLAFAVREPLSRWRRARSRGLPPEPGVIAFGLAWATGLVLCGVLLLLTRGWWLLIIAFPAGVLLLWQLRLTGSQRFSWQAEVLGAVGIALSAPALYLASRGSLDAVALFLWPVLFTHYAASVVHVRWLIRYRDLRRGRLNLALQVAVALAALVSGQVIRAVPPYLFLAYLPAVLKAAFALNGDGARVPVTRVGWHEVAYSLLFLVVALTTYLIWI